MCPTLYRVRVRVLEGGGHNLWRERVMVSGDWAWVSITDSGDRTLRSNRVRVVLGKELQLVYLKVMGYGNRARLGSRVNKLTVLVDTIYVRVNDKERGTL